MREDESFAAEADAASAGTGRTGLPPDMRPSCPQCGMQPVQFDLETADRIGPRWSAAYEALRCFGCGHRWLQER
jgi:hypothetical protein